MHTLYVVGTPIGNLEDISLRALRVLREVGVIAAEDTRTTRKLLQHYDIHTPLTSYHDFSGPGKTRRLIERVAAEPDTLVCYESPHRLLATLRDVEAVLGQRPLAAARELTKRFEEIVRGRTA